MKTSSSGVKSSRQYAPAHAHRGCDAKVERRLACPCINVIVKIHADIK
jgi:hypothetical protein